MPKRVRRDLSVPKEIGLALLGLEERT